MTSTRLRLLCAALLLASALPALGQERGDPLDPLRDAMRRQDELAETGRHDELVREARERAKDGTAESAYLLGRAYGNAALSAKRAGREREFEERLEESRRAFEQSRELGGLLFAPAHLGLARCARYRGDADGAIEELRQAQRIAPAFKAAALELAQVFSEKQLLNDAEYVLQRYLELRPRDTDARLLLGILKTNRKRWPEAEREFRAVLQAEPQDTGARKLLAANLAYQRKYSESSEHWEMVNRADPQDEESYFFLFHVYRELDRREDATAVLERLATALPGTEGARRARALLDELARDPDAWDAAEDLTLEDLARRLDSPDPEVVAKALHGLREMISRTPVGALPAAVYRLLARDAGTAEVRGAAVQLIAQHGDPRTLPILEILLFHPEEGERIPEVRREVARALSLLPSPAVVPVLYKALDDPDARVRESAVQGIAARTGKWFRPDLRVATPDAQWPAERALYRNWWESPAGAVARREGVEAMARIYEPMEKGRARLAEYALMALDAPQNERTWRAGFEFFRLLTRPVEVVARPADPSAEERRRVTEDVRAWFRQHAGEVE